MFCVRRCKARRIQLKILLSKPQRIQTKTGDRREGDPPFYFCNKCEVRTERYFPEI